MEMTRSTLIYSEGVMKSKGDFKGGFIPEVEKMRHSCKAWEGSWKED